MRPLLWRLGALLLIAAGYFALPNATPDLTRFNADDSEAYLGLSYALTHGLGYTRSLAVGFYVPHTTWPPGMPVLLAPVMAIAPLPVSWLAIKATVIVIGLSGVVLAWLYVARMTRSRAAADMAAVVLALQPFYWLFSRMALTEIPTVVFVLSALLIIDIVWSARRPTIWQALAVGLISGTGMVLRGTVAGLLFVPIAYAMGPKRTAAAGWRLIRLWLAHAAGFCCVFAAWALRNRTIDAKGLGFDGINQTRMLIAADPLDPASRLMGMREILYSLIDNVTHRIIYNVPEQLLPGLCVAHWRDWTGVPYLAVVLTTVLAFIALPRRFAMLPLFCVLAPYCILMLIYAWGGSVRFWVPITSLLGVMIVIGLAPALSSLRPAARRALLGGVLGVYGISLAVFVRQFEANPYDRDFADMLTVFERSRSLQGQPALMLTGHASLFTLDTGVAAPLTSRVRGVEPRYTHFIKREGSDEYPSTLPVPAGATELAAAGAWHMYGLPVPMTLSEFDGKPR